VTLALSGTVFSSASAADSNWPMFRGPQASGIGDDVSLAYSWKAPNGTRVKWRAAIPGLSHASPIVWGDRVYVLSAVSEGSTLDMKAEGVVFAKDTIQHDWSLHALDRETGRERWVRTVHRGTPWQPRHVRATYANATPATNGTHIALVLANEGLFVLDMDGTLLWRKEMAPPKPDSSLDPASSPVIVDDVVIVQNDWHQGGFVAAFDLKNGQERWRIARDEGLSWSTPGVFDAAAGKQIVLNSSRWIRALSPRDGGELWRLNNTAKGSWDRVVTPIAAEGLLIVAGGGGERPIYAVRPSATGDISLQPNQRASDAIAWTTERGSPYMPTPLAYRGLIYVCASNGVLAVYRANDGSLVYQSRLADGAGPFSASPVAAAGASTFPAKTATSMSSRPARGSSCCPAIRWGRQPSPRRPSPGDR
jgi:outer membrane protein assembly factor BamB